MLKKNLRTSAQYHDSEEGNLLLWHTASWNWKDKHDDLENSVPTVWQRAGECDNNKHITGSSESAKSEG